MIVSYHKCIFKKYVLLNLGIANDLFSKTKDVLVFVCLEICFIQSFNMDLSNQFFYWVL